MGMRIQTGMSMIVNVLSVSDTANPAIFPPRVQLSDLSSDKIDIPWRVHDPFSPEGLKIHEYSRHSHHSPLRYSDIKHLLSDRDSMDTVEKLYKNIAIELKTNSLVKANVVEFHLDQLCYNPTDFSSAMKACVENICRLASVKNKAGNLCNLSCPEVYSRVYASVIIKDISDRLLSSELNPASFNELLISKLLFIDDFDFIFYTILDDREKDIEIPFLGAAISEMVNKLSIFVSSMITDISNVKDPHSPDGRVIIDKILFAFQARKEALKMNIAHTFDSSSPYFTKYREIESPSDNIYLLERGAVDDMHLSNIAVSAEANEKLNCEPADLMIRFAKISVRKPWDITLLINLQMMSNIDVVSDSEERLHIVYKTTVDGKDIKLDVIRLKNNLFDNDNNDHLFTGIRSKYLSSILKFYPNTVVHIGDQVVDEYVWIVREHLSVGVPWHSDSSDRRMHAITRDITAALKDLHAQGIMYGKPLTREDIKGVEFKHMRGRKTVSFKLVNMKKARRVENSDDLAKEDFNSLNNIPMRDPAFRNGHLERIG